MATAHWCRIEIGGRPQLGRVEGERIALYAGDLLDNPAATGETVDPADAAWLPQSSRASFSACGTTSTNASRRSRPWSPTFRCSS